MRYLKLSLRFLAGTLLSLSLLAPVYGAGPSPKDRVGLVNFPFEVSKGEPAVPPGLRGRPQAPGRPGYLIVKFKEYDNAKDRERLSGKGVRFYGYVPVNAFLARVPYGRRGALASDPAVEFVGDYRPAYRLAAGPLAWVTRGESGVRKLILQAFDGEDMTPIKDAITDLGGEYEVVSDGPGLNEKFLRVEIDASKVAELASVDGVLWVEEERIPVLHNDVADSVLKADYVWGHNPPLKGAGQVVAVCDTGLDTGNTSTVHSDFSGNTSGGQPKIKQTFSYGRTNNWSDTNGHGTHTAGSAVGFGYKSNELVPGTVIRGMAYDAQLVFQSVLNNYSGLTIPDLNTTTFPDAYNAGARVHSNSWGYQYSAGSYYSDCVKADTYTWDHKDFTILFSAGNDGSDNTPSDGVVNYGSVSAPSTAKNVIAVGASENNRSSLNSTYGHSWSTKFPAEPIYSDRVSNNISGMVGFSGRGPCVDGRIKPDVVAPGTFVLSTKSTLVGFTNYWYWPSGAGYPSSLDTYYAFNGGTSMSCPLVAGTAALVREYLAGNGVSNPSSALIKGLLIAGAYDMKPGQYASPKNDVTGRPDNNQGWGRVDIGESLYPAAPKKLFYEDYAAGLNTDGAREYIYVISDTSVPVRVNLVWTDYPGGAYVSPSIVNDLDLIVTAPDGHVYHGNRYSGSESIPDDSAFDRLNNVEGVTIPSSGLTSGTLSVRVSAYNVPYGPEPFALVVSGGFSSPPGVTGIEPASGVNNAPTPVSVTGSDFITGASLYIGGTQCTVTGVTATTVTATAPAGMTAGAYDVKVTNPDGLYGTLIQGFQVVQDTTIPSAPQGVSASPGDASVNVRWEPVDAPDLSGYRVYFNGYSTSVDISASRRLEGLTNGQNYSINVKALDMANNPSPASGTVEATPMAPDPDLPHYNWDESLAWTCDNCHLTNTGWFLPAGFDYRTDASFCISCHNKASVAHNRTISVGTSHRIMVNVTSGTARMPSYGNVTSGEYSDTMYTHLKDRDKVVCATCHNVMQKPHGVGRAWEFTSSPDGRNFRASYGGWWDQGHAGVSVYNDSSLWTPALSRDREARRVNPDQYGFNEFSGIVAMNGQTAGYVYITLDDPYLRVPGGDNTICADCHAEPTHRGMNCLACHGAHNTVNMKSVKSSIRKPGGTYRQVVFDRLTGANSFADGGVVQDGVCEVCHESTLYYRFDGSGASTHLDGQDYDRKDCTACHAHADGFSP